MVCGFRLKPMMIKLRNLVHYLFYDKNLRMQLKVYEMFEFFTANISLIRHRFLISAKRD